MCNLDISQAFYAGANNKTSIHGTKRKARFRGVAMICLLEPHGALCVISDDLQQLKCYSDCLENVFRFTFQRKLLMCKVCPSEEVF